MNPQIPVAVFDLDGTLSDDRHRRDLRPIGGCNQADYDEYHYKCGEDKVNVQMKLFLESLHSRGIRICICTARPVSVANVTVQWLQDNLIPFTDLFMRGENDEGVSSADLKLGQIHGLPEGSRIILLIDDHPEVIAMATSRGIPTLQVRL